MQEAGREDWGNIDYLADVAYNAGWHIHQLAIEDVGYDKDSQQFLDLNNQLLIVYLSSIRLNG